MRYNIGVVFGGKSVEHEVSIISALQMIENMNKLNYNPIPIYLSKDNQFYYHENMFSMDYFKNLDKAIKDSAKVTFIKETNSIQLIQFKQSKIKSLFNLDIIFLVVHGYGCEDGTLSAYFEMLDIPYVGSSVLSSALNQNKWKMKQIYEKNDIPVVPYYGFYENDFYEREKEIIERCEEQPYPLIVKPASLGSSIGINKCDNRNQLKHSILQAFQYDEEVIVEKGIEVFMELNCAVLGDCTKQDVSLVEQVIQTDEILSYDDKYLRGNKGNSKGMVSTRRVLPAKIEDQLREEIEINAKKVFKVVGGSGVSRIDFLYDINEKKLYVNEINTIPGSLSYYLWEMSYKELINQLIDIALRRYRIKNAKTYSYETNILSMPKNLTKGKLS